MKNSRLPYLLLAIGCCGMLLTLGCNSTTKRKWLTALFDGVPPEHPVPNEIAAAVSGTQTNLAARQPTNAAPVVVAEPSYYTHAPFAQEKCASCHESRFGQSLKKKTPELCWDCHKDFLAAEKVKHQPVETGDCKSCHDPHQASNKKLLVKTGKALCLDCHDAPVAKGKKQTSTGREWRVPDLP